MASILGVFIEIGLAFSSDFALDLLETTARGEIHVDRALATGVRGVFAAGDVNDGRDRQVIIAAAEGANAALAAFNYLVHQVSASGTAIRHAIKTGRLRRSPRPRQRSAALSPGERAERDAAQAQGAGTAVKPVIVEYEPDTGLRHTEQIPLQEPGGIVAFLEREVFPHAPDAWYVPAIAKIGYEISFTRYFYNPQPMRMLEEITADIRDLERETGGLLDEIIGGANQ